MNRAQHRMQESILRKRSPRLRFEKFQKAIPPSEGPGLLGKCDRAWQNGWFAVLGRTVQTPAGEVLHLAIRNAPGEEISWQEKRWIKNQLAGEGAYAVEVFPSEDRIVDEVSMYHLWVLPAPLPFGIHRLDEPGHVFR